MQDTRIAEELGISTVPAVVIDGKLAECCKNRGVDEATLRVADRARTRLKNCRLFMPRWYAVTYCNATKLGYTRLEKFERFGCGSPAATSSGQEWCAPLEHGQRRAADERDGHRGILYVCLQVHIAMS